MLRVLEVFGEPIISGGQESFAINIVTHFNDYNTRIDFFTPYYCGNEYYRSIVRGHGGEVFECGLPFTPGRSRENTYPPLESHLKKNNYDVVHIHSGSVSILALASKAARKNGVKTIIVHSHSPAEHETIRHLAAKTRYFRALSSYPTNYFACSIAAAKWKYPKRIAERRVTIIKNGIDTGRYLPDIDIRNEVRSDLGIPGNAPVIGHVGRFSKEKNHVFLIDVFERIHNEKNNAMLLLVGDGELRAEIENIVTRKALCQSVIFTGNVTDVFRYMQAMDAFVLPSIYEGLPLVGVEAQAAGLPFVVSANVSQELNITGTLDYVDIGSIELWKDHVLKALQQPKKDNRKVLRDNGFDISDTIKTIKDIYCS